MFRKIASTVNCAANGNKFTMLVGGKFPQAPFKIGLRRNKKDWRFQNEKSKKETWQTA